jgi:hypothetical protein
MTGFIALLSLYLRFVVSVENPVLMTSSTIKLQRYLTCFTQRLNTPVHSSARSIPTEGSR